MFGEWKIIECKIISLISVGCHLDTAMTDDAVTSQSQLNRSSLLGDGGWKSSSIDSEQPGTVRAARAPPTDRHGRSSPSSREQTRKFRLQCRRWQKKNVAGAMRLHGVGSCDGGGWSVAMENSNGSARFSVEEPGERWQRCPRLRGVMNKVLILVVVSVITAVLVVSPLFLNIKQALSEPTEDRTSDCQLSDRQQTETGVGHGHSCLRLDKFVKKRNIYVIIIVCLLWKVQPNLIYHPKFVRNSCFKQFSKCVCRGVGEQRRYVYLTFALT